MVNPSARQNLTQRSTKPGKFAEIEQQTAACFRRVRVVNAPSRSKPGKRASIAIAAAWLCLLNANGCGAAEKPLTLYGQIDALEKACASSGVKLESKSLPARVGSVRLGSPAAYSGLQANDTVLSCSTEQNRLKLTIERDGKTYALSLATNNKALTAAMPKSDTVQTTQPPISRSPFIPEASIGPAQIPSLTIGSGRYPELTIDRGRPQWNDTAEIIYRDGIPKLDIGRQRGQCDCL